jgi:hypothetical protein
MALSGALFRASAGLTAYDGFDYGATTGDLTGKNGGSGWSGAYTDSGNSTIYTTPGLTYTGLPTTGGASKTADGGFPPPRSTSVASIPFTEMMRRKHGSVSWPNAMDSFHRYLCRPFLL